ncbi:MAG: acetyl-CoA carboxylase carboxyltransferase subunit [Deltaproteobacteria bacterium]|nr:acetyl-CoA carboxylase carboxyltransferase subunit [Deltaproteobacteria bacterium]
MTEDATAPIIPTLDDPFAPPAETSAAAATAYDATLHEGAELRRRPWAGGGTEQIARQHGKSRMTVWERINILTKERPDVLYENWGPQLDGASLVTAILKVGGRDVALYGHDFTVRAGSMDATNGRKLARLFQMAGDKGIPVIGLNDSAGAYVPAGVGGLDGYSEAFTALRKISGVVPSIMCMFGFNAGGGSYLPRQGSFVIQPADTFFGLTGPGVVKSVLGEDVSPDDLGGPKVHTQSGVADLTSIDEVGALRTALRLLGYLPSHNSELAPHQPTSDPVDRATPEIDTLLRKAFTSPSGFNTPFDISFVIQQIVDHGDYFELQPLRAKNTITAFGRIGGHVVGFVANNSAFASGQIDIAAAMKNARFIRFCNLYNIPIVFIEDTTGFLPGRDQEAGGIVHAGRAMLDAIIDVRTPRILLIVRNAFGGAYASFNCYPTGADLVLALPTTRLAVMGPAGKEFVYKDELRKLRAEAAKLEKTSGKEAATAYLRQHEAELSTRYEKELMNPREALSLGSISRIVQPWEIRQALGQSLGFLLRHYKPGPLTAVQREFH